MNRVQLYSYHTYVCVCECNACDITRSNLSLSLCLCTFHLKQIFYCNKYFMFIVTLIYLLSLFTLLFYFSERYCFFFTSQYTQYILKLRERKRYKEKCCEINSKIDFPVHLIF